MLNRILHTSLNYPQTFERVLFLEYIITEHYTKISEQSLRIDPLTTNVSPYRNPSKKIFTGYLSISTVSHYELHGY